MRRGVEVELQVGSDDALEFARNEWVRKEIVSTAVDGLEIVRPIPGGRDDDNRWRSGRGTRKGQEVGIGAIGEMVLAKDEADGRSGEMVGRVGDGGGECRRDSAEEESFAEMAAHIVVGRDDETVRNDEAAASGAAKGREDLRKVRSGWCVLRVGVVHDGASPKLARSVTARARSGEEPAIRRVGDGNSVA